MKIHYTCLELVNLSSNQKQEKTAMSLADTTVESSEWRALGKIGYRQADRRKLQWSSRGSAIWKLVYHVWGERVVSIGSSGSSSNTADRIYERVVTPKHGQWAEYACRDLLEEAGTTELFTACEGRNAVDRKICKVNAIEEEERLGSQIVGLKTNRSERLKVFELRSRIYAINKESETDAQSELPEVRQIRAALAKYYPYKFKIWDGGIPNTPDAVDDLGGDLPEPVSFYGRRYPRDPKVRGAVLKRARGRCEFCNNLGFLCGDGSRYLESHHIIALADEGPDRLSNVIALCAEHHREAHFGQRRSELESLMIDIVREKTQL